MQRKEAEKEQKGSLDSCLCGKCKAMCISTESLYNAKNEVSDEILSGNFLHFCLYDMNFMHTEAGIRCSEY